MRPPRSLVARLALVWLPLLPTGRTAETIPATAEETPAIDRGSIAAYKLRAGASEAAVNAWREAEAAAREQFLRRVTAAFRKLPLTAKETATPRFRALWSETDHRDYPVSLAQAALWAQQKPAAAALGRYEPGLQAMREAELAGVPTTAVITFTRSGELAIELWPEGRPPVDFYEPTRSAARPRPARSEDYFFVSLLIEGSDLDPVLTRILRERPAPASASASASAPAPSIARENPFALPAARPEPPAAVPAQSSPAVEPAPASPTAGPALPSAAPAAARPSLPSLRSLAWLGAAVGLLIGGVLGWRAWRARRFPRALRLQPVDELPVSKYMPPPPPALQALARRLAEVFARQREAHVRQERQTVQQVEAIEARLAAIEPQLRERLLAYEVRIEELERSLQQKEAENRELLRQQMEQAERELTETLRRGGVTLG